MMEVGIYNIFTAEIFSFSPIFYKLILYLLPPYLFSTNYYPIVFMIPCHLCKWYGIVNLSILNMYPFVSSCSFSRLDNERLHHICQYLIQSFSYTLLLLLLITFSSSVHSYFPSTFSVTITIFTVHHPHSLLPIDMYFLLVYHYLSILLVTSPSPSDHSLLTAITSLAIDYFYNYPYLSRPTT